MNKNINRFLCFGVIMLCSVICGQAQENLSLSECKSKALEHNQTIKAKQANYTASEASIKLAKRASLPNFDLDASYLYSNDPMQMEVPGFELPTIYGTSSGVYSPGSLTNLQYKNTYNANLGATLPLYLGGKLVQARQIAIKALSIAESEVALSQTDVLLSIEEQYWGLVSLIETQKLSQQSIDFLGDVVTDVTNFYESGVVTKNEVLKAQVELNNAKLADISLNNNIAMLKMSLNQSIGLPINNPISIADSTIDILQTTIADNDRVGINNRHEIQILNMMTDIYEAEGKMINAEYKPQLVAFGNYYFQNPNHLSQQEGELTWNAGMSLSIPVFHWGERSLKNNKAKMKVVSAEYQLDQTKELLALEINQSILKLNESLTQLQFTKEALLQAEENLKLETNRLKEEVSTTTDLLNAQLQWQKAHVDYISAKAGVKISEARCKKSIGELNP